MSDLEQLCRLHGQAVYRYLLSLCRDASLAEELTQETLLRGILNADGFRGESSLSVWLCQIAKHLYFDHRRKSGRTTSLEEAAALPDDAPDPVARLADRDTAERILTHCHGLDEPYKEVFLLHALGEVPLHQISRLFKKSDSWARVTYYRAKAKITAKLKEEGIE